MPARTPRCPATPGSRSRGEFAATTRRLRDARRAAGTRPRRVPREVTYLALHHQRMLRLDGPPPRARRRDARAPAARRPRRGARHGARAAPPRARSRASRTTCRACASRRRRPRRELRRYYAHGAAALRRALVDPRVGELRRVGVRASVRSASEAGARGPMQFLPSTWRAVRHGRRHRRPARRDPRRREPPAQRRAPAGTSTGALFAYNHSTSYVRAVRRFAAADAQRRAGVPAPTTPGRSTTAPCAASGGSRARASRAGAQTTKAPPERGFRMSRVLPRRYLMNRISEYFGSGQRSSATSCSSLSATVADVGHRRRRPCRACTRRAPCPPGPGPRWPSRARRSPRGSRRRAARTRRSGPRARRR